VARAKRTARADARRRHRAEQHLTDGTVEAGHDGGTTTTTTTDRSRAAVSAPPARMSIGQAFRRSFRPLDLRGDLAALPNIALHSKALWLPLLLVVGSAIAFGITQGTDLVTQFMFMYFVQTPAIGGVFIAGFLAPRASWLLGFIVGLAAAICYSALITTVFAAVTAAAQVQGAAQDAIIAAFLLSPVMGMFFAAAAAWYRRFLQLSNPNRGRQPQGKARRGPDGRSRAAADQKAGARR
jgi:hypothetical protein